MASVVSFDPLTGQLELSNTVALLPVGSTPNADGASLDSSQNLTLQPANTSFPGVLLAADWNTFNNKQPAGSYITALTGDATASGPGSSVLTLSNTAVTGQVLTGFIAGPNLAIIATDSILTAFEKIQAQATNRVDSINANGGTQETGNITLKQGNGLSITDSPAGTFTLDTNFGPNEFVITSTSGLVLNYSGGRYVNGQNGTVQNVPSGSITVAANTSLGYLYVAFNSLTSTGVVTASTTIPTTDSIPIAQFVSGASTVTSITDIRSFVNTVPLVNSLRCTYPGTGLIVYYNSGGVRINGTQTNVPSGNITLSASVSTGAIYVDPTSMVVTYNSTGIFPPNSVPMASYTTNGSAVTILTGARSFINNNMQFANAVSISSNSTAIGSSNSFAQSDHTHELTAGAAIKDSVVQYDGSNWQAVYPESLLAPSRGTYTFDDFIAFSNAGVGPGSLLWNEFNVGTGSGQTQPGTFATEVNHPGIITQTTGTTTTGIGSIYLGPASSPGGPILLGGGQAVLEWDIKTSTLGTTAQQYFIKVGFVDTVSQTISVPNNGVYFEYANGVNGDFWTTQCSASGTTTSVVTTAAVASNTWYRLTIIINAAANSAVFQVNGTTIATTVTNIPTSVSIVPTAFICKTAGTTARTMLIDYFMFNQRFTTPR